MSSTVQLARSADAARSFPSEQLVAWSGLPTRSLVLMVGEAERRRRFGYALQRALEARGLSERQLALRLEIDPRRVARWRMGKDLPDLYETQELVTVLRVSEDLFRNPPEVPEPPPYPIECYLLEDELSAAATRAADAAVDEALDARPGGAAAGGRRPRRLSG